MNPSCQRASAAAFFFRLLHGNTSTRHFSGKLSALILLLLFLQSFAFAQTDSAANPVANGKPVAVKEDTTVNHAKRACLLSAVLPGAGQIYNKKGWWYKLPVLYGGTAVLIYSIDVYETEYARFRRALIKRRADPKQSLGDPELEPLPEDVLLNTREYYRQQRDLSYVYLVGLYVLNIMEAGVTAHLKNFDVSENLSLRVEPRFYMVQNQSFQGISLCLRIK